MMSLEDPAVVRRLAGAARGLREHLNKTLPALYVRKSEDLTCKLISHGIGLGHTAKQIMAIFSVDIPLAAPTPKQFDETFATTVLNRIAKPDAWFEETADGVVNSLLVDPHEWTHVWQSAHPPKTVGVQVPLAHSVLYLAGCIAHTKDGEEYLAKVEGDAYAVTACSRKFFTGSPGDLEGYLHSIRTAYNLLGVGPDMAEAVLKSHFATMESGVVPNVTGARLMMEYLKGHHADLRGEFVF